MWRKEVDHRAAGIAEFQQLSDFVEGFARRVVAGLSHIVVHPSVAAALCQIKMGMTSADHQREHREFQFVIASLPLFQQHGVDVSFEMIDGDERLGSRKRQRFGKAETYEQRSSESGSLSYS